MKSKNWYLDMSQQNKNNNYKILTVILLLLIFIYLPATEKHYSYSEACNDPTQNIDDCTDKLLKRSDFRAIASTQTVTSKFSATHKGVSYNSCEVYDAKNWICTKGKTQQTMSNGWYSEHNTSKQIKSWRTISYYEYNKIWIMNLINSI
ncbi:MAG: hypothetical protein COA45_00195 [Zetaproteobacteria bacterium]|nr:MAG: hypothetical protein COA45_00195 [Zetaproteobacteria bacterium]